MVPFIEHRDQLSSDNKPRANASNKFKQKKKNQYMELLNDLQNKSEKSLTNVVNKLSG